MVRGVVGLVSVNAICWNGSFLVKFCSKQQFINPCTHLWLWLLFSSHKLPLEDVMLVVPAVLSQNKGNTKQRCQLARKQRKYHNYVHLCVSYDGTVNIYATKVLFPSYMISSGSSHVGSFFTNEEKKCWLMMLCTQLPYALLTFSWFHKHGLPCTMSSFFMTFKHGFFKFIF